MNTTTLFRPVGFKEAQLILSAEAKAFPPRLPEQPIFYPVLNFEYAAQIARQWNTVDVRSDYAGYVTEFTVDQAYLSQFEEHVVGAAVHRELWIPAGQLDEFNAHIGGRIQFKAAYFGAAFQPTLQPNNLTPEEITAKHQAILLNYPYWMQKYGTNEMLHGIKVSWQRLYPDIYLTS